MLERECLAMAVGRDGSSLVVYDHRLAGGLVLSPGLYWLAIAADSDYGLGHWDEVKAGRTADYSFSTFLEAKALPASPELETKPTPEPTTKPTPLPTTRKRTSKPTLRPTTLVPTPSPTRNPHTQAPSTPFPTNAPSTRRPTSKTVSLEPTSSETARLSLEPTQQEASSGSAHMPFATSFRASQRSNTRCEITEIL